MKQERIILSFIMVLIGLLVAGTAFYFYQSGKKPTPSVRTAVSPTPATAKVKTVLLTLTSPDDQEVLSNKNLDISGKTNPDATILLITDSDQQVLKPNGQGNFTTTTTLDNDQNIITVISILPSGDSKQIQETVTYSTSNF